MLWVFAAAAVLQSPPATKPLTAARVSDWVAAIYRRVPDYRFDWAQESYTPELRALIDRDARVMAAASTVGVLDGVPFCGCQDTLENYRVESITPRATGTNRFAVTVLLRNGQVGRFTLDVVQLPSGRLAIADLHSHFTPSLLALMRREVPKEEREARQSARR